MAFDIISLMHITNMPWAIGAKKEHKFPPIAMLAKTIFWQFNKPKWNQMDFFHSFGLLITLHCYHHNDHFRLDICQQKLIKWPTLDAWNPLILQVFVKLRQFWRKNSMMNLRWSWTWKISRCVWTIFYGDVMYDSHGNFFLFCNMCKYLQLLVMMCNWGHVCLTFVLMQLNMVGTFLLVVCIMHKAHILPYLHVSNMRSFKMMILPNVRGFFLKTTSGSVFILNCRIIKVI
jgi:hypothetical protein